MRAIWKNTTIAESDRTVAVDGNHYFPADSLMAAHFEVSTYTTVCGWKGTASYMHVVVDGQRNENAAWIYNEPKEAAKELAGQVAFWKGVEIVD